MGGGKEVIVTAKIEMYCDRAEEWRWRLRAPNGRIIADSSEGYNTKPGVRRSIANFTKYLAEAPPVEEIRIKECAEDVPVPPVKVSRPRAAGRKG